MPDPSISANEAYSLCFWVDGGASVNPPPPWQNVWQSSQPGAGFAAVVQNQNQPTSYVVVIQGTKNLMDAIFDMQVENQVPYPYVNGCNIAVGANNDMNQVLNNQNSSGVTLNNFLQNTVIKSSNQILITGHSLGGATTALLAPWIAYVLNNQQPITALPSNVTAITFAAPAIGDTNFANFLNGQSNYAANCNVNDAVPHAWCLTGQFSIPNLYLLFPKPGPHPMPENLKKKMEKKVCKMQAHGVSYQQTNATTFTFASTKEHDWKQHGEKKADHEWEAELGYQHNIAYDTQFGS